MTFLKFTWIGKSGNLVSFHQKMFIEGASLVWWSRSTCWASMSLFLSDDNNAEQLLIAQFVPNTDVGGFNWRTWRVNMWYDFSSVDYSQRSMTKRTKFEESITIPKIETWVIAFRFRKYVPGPRDFINQLVKQEYVFNPRSAHSSRGRRK